jgi:ribosomal protein S30
LFHLAQGVQRETPKILTKSKHLKEENSNNNNITFHLAHGVQRETPKILTKSKHLKEENSNNNNITSKHPCMVNDVATNHER